MVLGVVFPSRDNWKSMQNRITAINSDVGEVRSEMLTGEFHAWENKTLHKVLQLTRLFHKSRLHSTTAI